VSEAIEERPEAARSIHPGAVLRHGRESRGLSVEDVAQALKLTPRQVVAIEREEFDALPGNTFARGFLRNYARFLQLDPAPLISALERLIEHADVDLSPLSNAAGTMPSGLSSRSVPKVVWLFLLIAVVALVAVVYLDRFRPQAAPSETGSVAAAVPAAEPPPAAADKAASQSSPIPAAAPVAVAPEASPPAAPAEAPTAPAAVVASAAAPASAQTIAHRLTFSFANESWVQVRDGDGRVILSNNHLAGSSRVVEGRPPFSLIVGNAPGVTLTYDDRPIDLKPHTVSTVARLKLD
jgi:cytoskeleton protein RodZ